MNFKELVEMLEDKHKKMDASVFKYDVYVVLQDSSTFFFRRALVEYYEEWYVVFPEHGPFTMHHESDCVSVKQYTSVNIPIISMDDYES